MEKREVRTMQLAKKIRLYPTKQQEELFFQFAGTARFAWNESLAYRVERYVKCGLNTTIQDCIEHIQDLKYNDANYIWLKEVPEAVTKQAIKDLDKAYKLFFKSGFGKPKFKKKNKCKVSFYQRTDNFRQVDDTHIKITGIKSYVKIKKCEIPKKVSNTRVSFDGKYWYLSYTYDVQEQRNTGTDTLGIDLGIKDLAIVSNKDVYRNINKTQTIKKLEKQKKRLQRQVSRKYERNRQGKHFVKTANIGKLEERIRLLDRRLRNIRNTYIHEVTKNLVKTTPKRIVIEDLNVRGMMKNKHLSKAVSQQCFHKFREYLTYKCRLYGIELELADRWYPSSKLCSCCGNVKRQLSLSERVYRCEVCGFETDRDYNASINLSRYDKNWKKIIYAH